MTASAVPGLDRAAAAVVVAVAVAVAAAAAGAAALASGRAWIRARTRVRVWAGAEAGALAVAATPRRRAGAARAAGSVALLLAVAATAAPAQDVLPVPALSGRVIDQTGTLDAAQRAALQDKLAAFEAQAGPQIVVLLVPTTAPEDIASYAQRVADTWKIGRREVGDGVVLLVAKDDRRVRIEVAKALEGAIPDLAARQIVTNAVVPAFRVNDYAAGIDAAVDQLIARIKGEGLPVPAPRGAPGGAGSGGGLGGLEAIALLFFVAVPVVGGVLTRVFGRKLGSLLTAGAAGGVAWTLTTSLLLAAGAGVLALLVVGLFGIGSALRGATGRRGRGGMVLPPIVGGWGGGGGFGGGGFGGGGGGFSSGGGGDFGGGGASGSW